MYSTLNYTAVYVATRSFAVFLRRLFLLGLSLSFSLITLACGEDDFAHPLISEMQVTLLAPLDSENTVYTFEFDNDDEGRLQAIQAREEPELLWTFNYQDDNLSQVNFQTRTKKLQIEQDFLFQMDTRDSDTLFNQIESYDYRNRELAEHITITTQGEQRTVDQHSYNFEKKGDNFRYLASRFKPDENRNNANPLSEYTTELTYNKKWLNAITLRDIDENIIENKQLSYDADGRLSSVQSSTETWTLSYDKKRLATLTRLDATDASSIQIKFTYGKGKLKQIMPSAPFAEGILFDLEGNRLNGPEPLSLSTLVWGDLPF